MEVLYLCLLIFGILYALVIIIFDDVLAHLFDGALEFLHLNFIQPITLVGGLSILGGAGYLLEKYSSFNHWICFIIAFIVAIISAIIIYFAYVVPMENSESSISFSQQDLIGKIGMTTTSIPSQGYGEIMIKMNTGTTNQIASSFDETSIPENTQVIVIAVKEGIAYVSEFDEQKTDWRKNEWKKS